MTEPTQDTPTSLAPAGSSEDVVLSVDGLAKTFRIGFFRKKVEAVKDVRFEVRRGEIFGLLGPNGAGKTTTIKCVLRLIHPDRGQVRIFGRPPSDREAVRRMGYMPENPYVYQYLRPHEFLDLCGRLMGMSPRDRARRSDELLERVGLTHAKDRPIGKFSKGMMQRVGLAQALLHDPELLVLDEPMSGLDPIGRKEVRDLLLEQRRRGKTLIFTSHILSDVEMLCDRVTILQRGVVTAAGTMDALLHRGQRRVEVQLGGLSEEAQRALGRHGVLTPHGGSWVLSVDVDAVDALLRAALDAGARVESVLPHRETLENYFLRDPAPREPARTNS